MILKLDMKHQDIGQNIYVYENILGPEGCLPLPQGYIHVYDHNIETSSLKPLG